MKKQISYTIILVFTVLFLTSCASRRSCGFTADTTKISNLDNDDNFVILERSNTTPRFLILGCIFTIY